MKKDIDLSKEWIELVKGAMRSKITKEEFKKFLEEEKKKKNKVFDERAALSLTPLSRPENS
jgi:hypothetical protein